MWFAALKAAIREIGDALGPAVERLELTPKLAERFNGDLEDDTVPGVDCEWSE